MARKKTGMGVMTKIKLGAVGVVVLFVLLVLTMCQQQRAATEAVEEDRTQQEQEQEKEDSGEEKDDVEQIERIEDEDGEVVEIPSEAVEAAVEENVAEVQQPKDGEVDAYDCHGPAEDLMDTTVPVPAEVGTKVRCQLKMTTADGSEVDQNQVGFVTGFDSEDPASVRIEF